MNRIKSLHNVWGTDDEGEDVIYFSEGTVYELGLSGHTHADYYTVDDTGEKHHLSLGYIHSFFEVIE